MHVGLKLHTTNYDLIQTFKTLYDQGYYNYVELFIIPNTYESTINYWRNFNVQYVIHAPHSLRGFNPANADMKTSNRKLFSEVQMFADDLGVDIIIIHGGSNGSLDEMITQVANLNDRRITIENKPMMGLNGKLCVGCTPNDFHSIAGKGILHGMALDFGHAVCTANYLKRDALELIDELMTFQPKIYHLSDGNSSSITDTHLNLGKGDFGISKFLSRVPKGSFLTLETPRESTREAALFIEDVNTLNGFLRSC